MIESSLSVIWVSVLLGLIVLVQFFRYLKRRELELESIVQSRFIEHKPIFMDKNARLIAQESRGYSQKSGMGSLVLSSQELYFKSQLFNTEIIIPIDSLVKVSETRRMLGKNPLRTMLRIDYRSDDEREEAIALLVKDLPRWKIELSRLIEAHTDQS